MKVVISIAMILSLLAASQTSGAQSPVTALALSPDRIGEIKTAPGITTMIRFPDAVQEIICGDLYDAATGKGTFVVQRSGTADHPGNEVFVKPVSSKGLSNMFVKTGEGKHTYSFDLSIVSTPQAANRMVNVTDLPAPGISGSSTGIGKAARACGACARFPLLHEKRQCSACKSACEPEIEVNCGWYLCWRNRKEDSCGGADLENVGPSAGCYTWVRPR